jgi:hypothetical protein
MKRATLNNASGGGASSSLLSGLQFYYKLEDTSDSSGNGSTLTNSGAVTFIAGKVNNAANFIAASSQKLSVASNSFNQPASGDFSLSFWVFVPSTNTSNFNDFISKGLRNAQGYTVEISDGILILFITDGSNSANLGYSATSINDNTWRHFVATIVRGGTNTLYLNGTSVNTSSMAGVTGSLSNTTGFAIGWDGSNTATHSTGLVDECGYWNRALSSVEVTCLYNGGAGSTYPFTGLC